MSKDLSFKTPDRYPYRQALANIHYPCTLGYWKYPHQAINQALQATINRPHEWLQRVIYKHSSEELIGCHRAYT